MHTEVRETRKLVPQLGIRYGYRGGYVGSGLSL